MSTKDTTDYDTLAERLTDPEHPVRSTGQVETAKPEDEAGRGWLLREYGTHQAVDAAAGRRRAPGPHGPSPHRPL